MLRRPFTFAEQCFLVLAADRVRREVDAELGALLRRVAHGDDTALPAVHDRLNVLGEFAGADRLRRTITQ